MDLDDIRFSQPSGRFSIGFEAFDIYDKTTLLGSVNSETPVKSDDICFIRIGSSILTPTAFNALYVTAESPNTSSVAPSMNARGFNISLAVGRRLPNGRSTLFICS